MRPATDVPADLPAAGQADPFAARTPWSARGAVAVTILIVLVAYAAAALVQPLTAYLGRGLMALRGVSSPHAVLLASAMVSLLVMQAVMIALAVALAGRYGARRCEVLSLPRELPLRGLVQGIAGMGAVTIPFSLLMWWLFPETFSSNLRFFAELAASPAAWLAGLAVIVGAPLAEELLFRGFLLPALTKVGHGFPGAAMISTLGWTLLHFNYSIAGLIEVFMIGLFLCWLVRRTGNLWINIALHAFYNGLQFAVLTFWPRLLGF